MPTIPSKFSPIRIAISRTRAFSLILLQLLCVLVPLASDAGQSLAGGWRFAPDPEDIGVGQGWAAGKFDGTIQLPGSTDEAGLGDLQADTGKTMGHLVRKHNYLGAVWFAREILIPENPAAEDWTLTLERVMWQSRVFVDGKEVGPPQDSLCTPHVHRLGKLGPGKHLLAIRVDNRMIHPIGNKCHAYGEQTQSRWNGIVGGIELAPVTVTSIASLRVFTTAADKSEIEVRLSGATDGVSIRAAIVDPADGRSMAASDAVPALAFVKLPLASHHPLAAWSEFTPKIYRAKVELLRDGKVVDSHETACGFRSIARDGNKLLINGSPAFMRGNLDCIHFPKSGYPSTRKADWLAIFAKYREHNLNHVRFHSWCPPEAAFDAADELGIYIQAEGPIWIDGWMTAPNPRLEMDCEGYPQGLGRGDRTIDSFAQAEFQRIIDTYGNHPSFAFFCFGNELGPSDFQTTGQWVAKLKEHDPRRLYAASTAREITAACDFNSTHNIPSVGMCRQHYQFGTNWDYQGVYGRSGVPIIAHEIGQWPVYPDWSICEKFTGTLRNTRLETLRKQATANGVISDQAEFTKSSGALNQRLYKDEIESFLRTPDCRGFQLLSIQDFQGQGDAYVGWLDCFWDSKGTTDSAVFRGYCAPVVAMAKLPSYIFTDGDSLACDLLVRNDGPAELRNAKLTARLLDSTGAILGEKSFTYSAPKGGLVTAGKTGFTLTAASARRLTLVLAPEGRPEANTYPLWVYPKSLPPPPAGDLMIASDFGPATEEALAKGRAVLLDASGLGTDQTLKQAAWMPLYWALPFFPGQGMETLGLVVRNNHPAFADFPTENFNDWQWQRLCQSARGFDLTGLVPESFKPIAQPVSDFHLNRKLGSIFECRVGPGKLLVCGYPLSTPFPEAAQLRHSLTKYAASDRFLPTQPFAADVLRKLFNSSRETQAALPGEFANAAFHLVAAGNLTASGPAPADPALNRVLLAKDGYKLASMQAEGCWKDETCTSWFGRHTGFKLQVPSGISGTLCVRFTDHNSNGRTGKITFEGRESRLDAHAGADGHWVKIDILREDSLDTTLAFAAETLTGPNLMIANIVFLPKQ
jgi:beta-galactosidase